MSGSPYSVKILKIYRHEIEECRKKTITIWRWKGTATIVEINVNIEPALSLSYWKKAMAILAWIHLLKS